MVPEEAAYGPQTQQRLCLPPHPSSLGGKDATAPYKETSTADSVEVPLSVPLSIGAASNVHWIRGLGSWLNMGGGTGAHEPLA